jgi:hypothetical protein
MVWGQPLPGGRIRLLTPCKAPVPHEPPGPCHPQPALGWVPCGNGRHHSAPRLLGGGVLLNGFTADPARRAHEIRSRPQGRKADEVGQLPAQQVRGVALQAVGELVGGHAGVYRKEQMHVVGHDCQDNDFPLKFSGLLQRGGQRALLLIPSGCRRGGYARLCGMPTKESFHATSPLQP